MRANSTPHAMPDLGPAGLAGLAVAVAGVAITLWAGVAGSAVLSAWVALCFGLWRLRRSRRETADHLPGLAARREIAEATGTRALMTRRHILRPSLEAATASELGYLLGQSRGVDCWASVEDSLIVLGPPRSGKGLHCVIPMILDAPGGVLTTSTRPDNLAATLHARSRHGPVAVFDPQGLASGVRSLIRWSPIRGCEAAGIAMARARALCTEPPSGTENASFWTQQCYTVTRCLLHAAALDARGAVELLRWSLSPAAAQDAVDILASHPSAAPTWASALEAVLSADLRLRDSVWATVSNVFAALADPRVLDAVSPTAHETFDPVQFLRERGTLYLLGTASGASATASLISAFVEDVVDSARRLAAASAGARLDPPLTIVLDEAANYPLSCLPSLMSDGGGSGISTTVVLQSLAQARARWGQEEAAAIWDSAIVKIILGGSGHASDLRDLSSLSGVHEQRRLSESWGPDGRKSVTASLHEVPILDPGRIRTLPFGKAILLLRAAPPILLTLRPWTARRDASSIQDGRSTVERQVRESAAALHG
ncbi:MAG: TraM recognition domain-containing protein [Actinomycetota bacterium]|nr:TraM recognition domain-containing protein [Actinomycetota bacterium]